ncbi:hypothetical protein O3M35_002946 [Rhynocoris fuscipes]|uniref:26S proteasome non-ATPase regulatory subunit 5 n=1 Tax=Rhynocoris fuscipes TaxID=488301 RepID=A0AAW1CHB7_9HEMI
MNAVSANIENLLENIRNDIDVGHNLSELKIALGSLNTNQLTNVFANVQLAFIFDCLNSSVRKQVLTTCDILSLILSVKPITVVLSDYATSLVRALGHPVKEVKEMVIKELIRGVGENELISVLNSNILEVLVDCLCDEEISVATYAIEFFTKLGQTTDGLNVICQDSFVREITTKTKQSDVYKIRMYQVLVDISVKSSEGLSKIESSGFFIGMIDELKSSDTLAVMALILVITPLVPTVHGFDFLVRNDIVELVADQIVTSEHNPLASLIYPGFAKFFGHVGRAFPQRLVASYPQVLQTLFKSVDSNDVSISIVSLETIAFIAYSPPGKATLYKQDDQLMRHVMAKLHESITTLPTEWRVRALAALADIIHLSSEFVTSDITKVSLAWFNQLGPSAMQVIYEMARQPFPEIKAAAFHVLEEIAVHRWGQTKIANHPGLFEFLLDRSTETTLEGKQAKYDLIKTLYNSPTISSTFEEEQCARMSQYLEGGVINVQLGNHIAVEGAD